MLPMDIPGRGRRTLRGALVVLALSGMAGALAPATAAVAAPRRADIAIDYMATSLTDVIVGDSFGVTTIVRNAGTRASEAVTVTVTLPEGLQATSAQPSFASWDCSFTAPAWTCSHAGLAAGETADPLSLPAQVVGATPGDVLTVVSKASTTSRELTTANNTGQVSVNVVAPAVIRGTVWIDVDRDGQRDPDEPRVSSGPDGVQRLLFIPQNVDEGGSAPIHGVVAADGTYTAQLRPGYYVVQMEVSATLYYFTTPDVGDDATDSDLVYLFSDPEVRVGRTAAMYVSSGSDTVVDAGLIDRTM